MFLVTELKTKVSNKKLHTDIPKYGNLPFQTFGETENQKTLSFCTNSG